MRRQFRFAACVVTATMDNYARFRHHHLADWTVDARELYDGTSSTALGFTPH